ncbi:uncharacterized protein LOC133380952 isoform X2 [Rhineura floridana]|uniref:uncharacterized protein LOC133380952 isoform X2 n=1 Tax=Rhineura floridana TaxID=261503 RepID=UPI002AC888DF|nr:uncharacterized protein LOC133380952 isoform X2 [Rhineura floridana]
MQRVVMAKLWLFGILVVPNYFQVRWRFVTGARLVLILKADNCIAENGTQQWKDSCVISIDETEVYSHRAKLSSEDASLVLRNVTAEDSGIYCITLLALDLMLSANINLTVTKGRSASAYQAESSTGRPVLASSASMGISFIKSANDRDYTVSNIIQLSLAGLILCLLGLIIAEHISDTCWNDRHATTGDGNEAKLYRAGMKSTFPPMLGNISLLLEMPSSDDVEKKTYYNIGL